LSTRSAIARPRGDGWEGVYCHSDGYPTGVGQDIWKLVHEKFNGDGEAFLKEYLDKHPSGWSIFPDNCYCHHPDWAARADHKTRITVSSTEDKTDTPLHIEWVYIVAPGVMTILKSFPLPEPGKYAWCIVTQVEFSDVEPDWAAIEKLGEDMCHNAWEKNRPSDAA